MTLPIPPMPFGLDSNELSGRDIIPIVESFSITERGRQVALGVSEVGMECQRCVIRKLAGLVKTEMIGSWRAQLGTYVHDNLAREFQQRFPEDTIIEDKLFVHAYKNFLLMGSCDAYFKRGGRGLVLDWKIVGDDTLEKVRKHGAKRQYIVQGHLYALGWLLRGLNPTDVCIMFLPANKGSLSQYAVPVEFPFDPQVAIEALAHIERYIDLAEEIGWDALLRQTFPTKGCLSCRAYEEVDDPVYDLTLRK